MDIRRATLVALFLPALCPAQSMHPEDLAPGKILVTPRESPDPLFSHSVIVLARYDRTGALGLMIHFRSNLTIRQALAGIKGIDKRTDPVFVGGPVELSVVMALVRSHSQPPGASLITGNLYLMTSKESIKGLTAADSRLFVGYTGWAPGQLDREVRRSGWYIFDYDESLVFDDHPETLWTRLIQKTGLKIAAFPYNRAGAAGSRKSWQ